ncbi:MAG: hypothetical protein KUF74_01905 [Candidatus Thiodiazotropha sp. (ex Ctena orbiculata)]|nr:hypothetical protein [Candidatus Thiodiazotropha taylori]
MPLSQPQSPIGYIKPLLKETPAVGRIGVALLLDGDAERFLICRQTGEVVAT